MAIPVTDADEQLKRMLNEPEDTVESGAAFPQDARYRALQEAVVAIARLRPDLFSVTIELAFDADSSAFTLPDQYEYPLEVLGLKNEEGCVTTLRPSTEADRVADNQLCWRCNKEGGDNQAGYFIWSPQAPRKFYVDGDHVADKLLVTTSGLDGFRVDGNATNLPLPYTYFPELIDYALSRLYARQDTSAGDSSFYLQRFNQLINDQIGVNRNRNPLVSAAIRSSQ